MVQFSGGRANDQRIRVCIHDAIHQLLNLLFKARHFGSEVRAIALCAGHARIPEIAEHLGCEFI